MVKLVSSTASVASGPTALQASNLVRLKVSEIFGGTGIHELGLVRVQLKKF